jgi:hypothetical protein
MGVFNANASLAAADCPPLHHAIHAASKAPCPISITRKFMNQPANAQVVNNRIHNYPRNRCGTYSAAFAAKLMSQSSILCEVAEDVANSVWDCLLRADRADRMKMEESFTADTFLNVGLGKFLRPALLYQPYVVSLVWSALCDSVQRQCRRGAESSSLPRQQFTALKLQSACKGMTANLQRADMACLRLYLRFWRRPLPNYLKRLQSSSPWPCTLDVLTQKTPTCVSKAP